MLCSLETLQHSDRRGYHTVKLIMPATNGSLQADLENLGLPRGLLKEDVTLGDFPQAVALVSLLLNSFGSKATVPGLSKRGDFILRQNLPWVLNGYTRLRRVKIRWLQRTEQNPTSSEEQVSLQLLASTRRFCISQSSESVLPSDMSLAHTWVQCLSEFTHLCVSHHLPTLQAEISHFLDEVVKATKQSTSSLQLLKEAFLPILTEFKYQNPNTESLEPSLYVMTSPVQPKIHLNMS